MSFFTRDEVRVVAGTSAAYALRMLGLYMALPVMSTWAAGLPGATPFLVGVAIGAYGLTQAIFQIPFGILGDLRGRRLVVILSMVVFALGSSLVASSGTIWMVIAGRLVQGVGAMASTLIALIGDGTRDHVRTRAMALMGMIIGVAFAGGFLLGPVAAARAGVASVFGLAAILSLAGVVLFELVVPNRLVPHIVRGRRTRPAGGSSTGGSWSWEEARSTIRDPSVFVLDAGIFVLHAAVTGLFVVVPFLLEGLVKTLDLWRVYAPVLLAGLGAMLVASRQADRPRRARLILRTGGALVIAGLVGLAIFHRSALSITLFLTVFVAGFASVEPVLASLLTRFTGKGARGTAAGVFNMVQFSGAFLGGSLAGLVLPIGQGAPLALMATLAFGWWLALGRMRHPDDVLASTLEVPRLDAASWPRVRRALLAQPGVLEAEWADGARATVRHWGDRASVAHLEGLAGKSLGPDASNIGPSDIGPSNAREGGQTP